MSESIPRIFLPTAFHDDAPTLTPKAPDPKPPAEWQAGALYVNEQLQELRDQVADRLQTLLGTIDQTLFDALQSAAHEAAALHTALVKTSHFDSPVDEVPPHLRQARVRDYRRDTMRRVIAPLRRQLKELNLGVTLEAHWQAFWEDLAALPPRLPVSITRPEPETLYTPMPEDGLLVALRKRLVLARRHIQPGAPPSVQGSFYAQEVPLRTLAAYHLRARLPHRLREHKQAVYQQLARPIAAFERAVTRWTHRLLEAERHLDRPADDLSEHADCSFPRPSEADHPASPVAASDVWKAVNAEAQALGKQLRTLSALSFTEHSEEITFAVQTAWADLKTDADQADSFLLQRKDRTIPAATPQQGEAKTPWIAWHQQAVNRLTLCEAIASLHDTAHEREETFLRALIDTGAEPLAACFDDATRAVQKLREEAAALFDEDLPLETRRARLHALRDRALQTLESQFVVALQEARLHERVSEVLDVHIAQWTRFFDLDRPPLELHALAPPEAEAIAPDAATGDVNLQDIAQRHFDSFFADTLRHALPPLQKQIEAVTDKAGDVVDQLRAALDAALDALESAAPDEEKAVAAARAHALGGLDRSADAVEVQARDALAAFPPLATAVNRTFTTALADLRDRASVESRIRDHRLDFRSLVPHDAQADPQTAAPQQPPLPHTSCDSLYPMLRCTRNGKRPRIDLPLFYQRLFAFRPVVDPDLLVGRSDDLARFERHIDQWQRGRSRPLMLTGRPGSGRTSLLNVVQKTLLQDANVHRITLDERVRSESAFAECVARALGLSLSRRNGQSLTLDQLRAHLQTRPHQGVPRVCIVEHFEHLFLRAIHGTDLAERVLAFMARTGAEVLWLATVSEYGEQLLNRMAPTALQRVRRHRLSPIDRSLIETLVMTRHRRSGLPLVFEPPEEPAHALHQTRTFDAKQSALKATYFDRLHTRCGSNLALAFFYWIRSVHFDEERGVLRVRPLQPLDVDVLERLSLPSAFLLRAFLRHTTLTPEEYSEVGQVSLDESLAHFEVLYDATLLQPAASSPHSSASPVEPARRFRLHPLVIHPVTKHLREEHLLCTHCTDEGMEMRSR